MAQRVGYLYVKLALVLLIRRYRFSVHPRNPSPVPMSPMTADRLPSEGVYLNVQRLQRDDPMVD